MAEYTFPSSKKNQLAHIEFSKDDCREFVYKEVNDFLEKFTDLPNDRPIVLGISGGGDSNTFLDAFIRSPKIKKEQLIAVMMLGVPDWDLGKQRAQELCDEYGVKLQFVERCAVSNLLGKKSEAWAQDFEKVFPNDDVEVLGTLAIRLALLDVAKSVNAQAVCTGLNLEDLLSEAFLFLMKGQLPMPFPVRNLGTGDFWYPLFRIPKKILDGCNPKYSLENYKDRYPSNLMGRAIPYYLTQMQHNLVPGIEFDLLDGFQKLSVSNKDYLKKHPEFPFWIINEEISEEVSQKWKVFLNL